MKQHDFACMGETGPMTFKVDDDLFKVCKCGHRFVFKRYLVTWVKAKNRIDAKPMPLEVPIYTCQACGEVIDENSQTLREWKKT